MDSRRRSKCRRQDQYWKSFNDWWRAFKDEKGCRPTNADIREWYYSPEGGLSAWADDDRPTEGETIGHSKGMRSLEEVRSYFRRYRRQKAAAKLGTDGQDTSTEEDEDASQRKKGARRSDNKKEDIGFASAKGLARMLSNGHHDSAQLVSAIAAATGAAALAAPFIMVHLMQAAAAGKGVGPQPSQLSQQEPQLPAASDEHPGQSCALVTPAVAIHEARATDAAPNAMKGLARASSNAVSGQQLGSGVHSFGLGADAAAAPLMPQHPVARGPITSACTPQLALLDQAMPTAYASPLLPPVLQPNGKDAAKGLAGPTQIASRGVRLPLAVLNQNIPSGTSENDGDIETRAPALQSPTAAAADGTAWGAKGKRGRRAVGGKVSNSIPATTAPPQKRPGPMLGVLGPVQQASPRQAWVSTALPHAFAHGQQERQPVDSKDALIAELCRTAVQSASQSALSLKQYHQPRADGVLSAPSAHAASNEQPPKRSCEVWLSDEVPELDVKPCAAAVDGSKRTGGRADAARGAEMETVAACDVGGARRQDQGASQRSMPGYTLGYGNGAMAETAHQDQMDASYYEGANPMHPFIKRGPQFSDPRGIQVVPRGAALDLAIPYRVQQPTLMPDGQDMRSQHPLQLTPTSEMERLQQVHALQLEVEHLQGQLRQLQQLEQQGPAWPKHEHPLSLDEIGPQGADLELLSDLGRAYDQALAGNPESQWASLALLSDTPMPLRRSARASAMHAVATDDVFGVTEEAQLAGAAYDVCSNPFLAYYDGAHVEGQPQQEFEAEQLPRTILKRRIPKGNAGGGMDAMASAWEDAEALFVHGARGITSTVKKARVQVLSPGPPQDADAATILAATGGIMLRAEAAAAAERKIVVKEENPSDDAGAGVEAVAETAVKKKTAARLSLGTELLEMWLGDPLLLQAYDAPLPEEQQY